MDENADEYAPAPVFSRPTSRSTTAAAPMKPPKQPPAQPPVFQQAPPPTPPTPEQPKVIVVESVALPSANAEDKKATCCGCLTIPPIAPTALIGVSTVLAFGSGFFGSSYMSFGSGVISVIALVLQRRASMLAAIETATSPHHHV
jgi:hypothetical protein